MWMGAPTTWWDSPRGAGALTTHNLRLRRSEPLWLYFNRVSQISSRICDIVAGYISMETFQRSQGSFKSKSGSGSRQNRIYNSWKIFRSVKQCWPPECPQTRCKNIVAEKIEKIGSVLLILANLHQLASREKRETRITGAVMMVMY